jgi:hypothetical protein
MLNQFLGQANRTSNADEYLGQLAFITHHRRIDERSGVNHFYEWSDVAEWEKIAWIAGAKAAAEFMAPAPSVARAPRRSRGGRRGIRQDHRLS